jgi:hypothetical protein
MEASMPKQAANKTLEIEVANLKVKLSTAERKISDLEKLLKAASKHKSPWEIVANWWNHTEEV